MKALINLKEFFVSSNVKVRKEATTCVLQELANVVSNTKVEASTVEIKLLEAPKEIKLIEAPNSVVSFKNVTKKFGQKVAVQDITFDIFKNHDSGEMISLVGPSGCGKSTVLRMIAGLTPQYPQTSGDILIFEKNICGTSVDRGVVDQKYSLMPNLNVVDNIAFGLKLNGVGKKERKERAREWVKKINLEGSEEKYPSELSGGMQQRVSLAATLILCPKIILMDEPFGALDPKTRLRMQELLVSLWKEIKATVIIVTHSMEEAVYLGDRVFRMESNPGRLVEILEAPRPDIPPEEMRKRKWFNDMVRELLSRIENSTPAKGSLLSKEVFNENKAELELLKLFG